MKLRLAAATAATGLAASALFAGAAGAQDPAPLPITVDPTSGTDAIFTVSGTDCLQTDLEGGIVGPGVIDIFIDGQPLSTDDPENPDLANEDGTWAIEVSPVGGTPPPGVVTVTATCTVNDGTGTQIVTYGSATYEILPGQETTTTTAPPAPAPAPEAPAPAEPVVAEPTYTG